MVYTISEIAELVLPVVRKYRIPVLYIFGSYARGDATAESDLDFLVDTTGTDLTSLLSFGSLYCELEEIFQKPIDLVTMGAITQSSNMESDVEFNETIMKERVSIFNVA